jgi:RNAse (barnase) inhibitor barstar
MQKKLIIDGNHFSDLAGFYNEVERNLTKDLDWKIGRNLDAYNDVLRGGFGVHEYGEPITLTWINSEKSKRDFGWNATVNYREQILTRCHPDNIPYVEEDIAKAKAGEGQTLFDEIVEITRGHEHVELLLQ